MNTPNDGGPAFPVPDTHYTNANGDTQTQFGTSGMSLRDWFAGKICNGMASNPSWENCSWEQMAEAAYHAADAMLAAREKANQTH